MTDADDVTAERPARKRSPIRRVLRWTGMVLGVVTVLSLIGMVWLYMSWRIEQRDVALDTPLAIPPLAESTVDDQGRTVFDLTAQVGETELLDGVTTATWGYDGSYLGPTLRAERGDEVLVNVTNELPEDTTTHWHGMELPAVMDGGPHQPIEVGETWSPTWRIDQPAATLWYHPHLHTTTAPQVYRGLAGLFIVDDPATAGTLPETYGVDDVPLVVQDRRFDADGGSEPYGDAVRITGMLGDTIVVNGTVGPVFEATTELVRFRVLNASPARVYRFTFTDGREFSQVATDVALLPEPVPMTSLQLSPGERAEIVVAVEPGDDVVLRSEEPDLGANILSTRLSGGHDTFDILRVVAAEALRPSSPLPRTLPVLEDAALPADTEPDRTFELGDFTINDVTMDHERIDAHIHAGSSEIWEVRNTSMQPHNWHVHGVRFRVLSSGDDGLPDHHRGWKDTVYVPPGDRIRLAIDFVDHADEEHPFMFHCHLLYHEDNGMMGQFVLVDDPDQHSTDQHDTGQHGTDQHDPAHGDHTHDTDHSDPAHGDHTHEEDH